VRTIEFCDHCDIRLDLHDGDDSCEYAAHKVRMQDMVNDLLWRVVGGPR
jgi:hypothetical protein